MQKKETTIIMTSHNLRELEDFCDNLGLLYKGGILFESEIDSLEELGEYIGNALTKAMEKIPWERIYKKARNFGKGLADFLNGLINFNGLRFITLKIAYTKKMQLYCKI